MKSGKDFDPIETREWIESLDDVIDDQGTDRASFLLNELANVSWIRGRYLLII